MRAWLARIYRRIKKTEADVNGWKSDCFRDFQELYSTDAESAFNEFLNDSSQ